MGDVYRVWDYDTRRELASNSQIHLSAGTALLQKGVSCSRVLSHPNLVTLYDLHCEDEQYFYTMDIVDGSTFTST